MHRIDHITVRDDSLLWKCFFNHVWNTCRIEAKNLIEPMQYRSVPCGNNEILNVKVPFADIITTNNRNVRICRVCRTGMVGMP